MAHPGESINFDGQDLQEEQEEELAFEDRNREQELRDLLSKALPDDLLEDDGLSIPSSRESSSLSSCSPDMSPRQPSLTEDDQHHWLYKPDAYHHASTPHVWGGAPPLKTPAGVALVHEPLQISVAALNDPHGPHDPHGPQGAPNASPSWSSEHSLDRLHIPEPNADLYSQGLSPTTVAWEVARQRTYGNGNQSDSDFSDETPDDHHAEHGEGSPQRLHHEIRSGVGNAVVNGHREEGDAFGYHLPDHISAEEDFTGERRHSQQYEPPKSAKPRTALTAPALGWSEHGQYQAPHPGGRGAGMQGVVHRASSEPTVGQVHYQRRRDDDGDGTRTDAAGRRRVMEGTNGMDHYQEEIDRDPYQDAFNHAGSRGRDVAQLEILYQARGREIQNLTSQLETLREEGARDKRILNHQLAMAQDERDGLGNTYGENQQLLNQLNNENHSLKGNLQAVQQQIQSLTETNQQLHGDLDTASAAIESLNHQLMEVQRSQPLLRAREQQESLLVGLEQKFRQEVANLKEKVDSASRSAAEKSALVEQLEARLSASLKGADQARLEHAETVNRLTASLQDSQKRCQELLLQGSLPVVQELQVRLQESSTARTMTENMCQTLQEELAEMKDQIMLYEGAVDLGVISEPGGKITSPKTPTDADVVRNLAKEDWKTPQPAAPPTREKEPLSPKETLVKLKAELSRSLQSIRSKREHVTKLQVDLREARNEGQMWKGRVEGAETRVSQMEAQLEALKSTILEAPTKAVRDAREEEQMEKFRSELETKTKECREKEDKLAMLKAEMGQMVAENDQDKKEALDRCQKTCLQLHEDSSRNMREQLVKELQAEKETMLEAHQYQLQQVRNEMAGTENELHKTKQLYIELCDEKKRLEGDMEERIATIRNESVEQVRSDLEKGKTDALEELKSSLETSHRAEIVLIQEKHKREKQEELDRFKADQETFSKQLQVEHDRELNSLKTRHDDLQKNLESQITLAVEKAKAEMMENNAVDKKDGDDNKQIASMEQELKALQERYAEIAASVETEAAAAVKKAQEEWLRHENQRRMSLDRVAASSIEQMKADHALQLAEWQAKFSAGEQDGTDRVSVAVREARETWRKDEDRRRRESLARKDEESNEREAEVEKELQRLNQEVRRSREAVGVAQRDSKQVRAKYAQLKGRHEREVAGLRGELRSCQAKLQQAEKTLQEELEQLQRDMREANSVTLESMQERVSAIQQKHTLLVEKMKEEWEEERQRLSRERNQRERASIAVQTTPSDESDIIAQLRTHYLGSVENVRASAMSYVADMQKRCQETLRVAVFEERQRVGTKMRKFYTKQVQSLRETQRENKRAEQDGSSIDHPVQEGHNAVTSSSTSRPTANQANISSRADGHLSMPRTGRRQHVGETPRSTLHQSSNAHPINHLRASSWTEKGLVVPQEQQDTQNMASGPSVHSRESHGTKQGQDVSERAQHVSMRSQEQDKFRRLDQSNQHSNQGRQLGNLGKQSLTTGRQNEAHAFHQFNREDIGEKSAALLNGGEDVQHSAQSMFDPAVTASVADQKHIVKTQQQLHHNVTRRRSGSSGGGPSQLQSHNKPYNVLATNANVPPHNFSQPHPQRTRLPSKDAKPVPLLSTGAPNYSRQYSEEPNLSIGSLGSEYAELPKSLYENGVSLPEHPFLSEDVTQDAQVPKRVMELQHSGASRTQPVRDIGSQNVFYVQRPNSGGLSSVSTTLKAMPKTSKTLNEDSGINSPAYIQQ